MSSVCQSVCLSTLLNINTSETSGPIATKFYMKHCGGGKAALGVEQDRIGTLVSMATDSSHRVIMGGNLKKSSFLKQCPETQSLNILIVKFNV